MDILYSRTVQGFCIVSSDSDYTRLCTRIRELGLFVMGMGRKQTPEAFVNACDVFVHVENLEPPPKAAQPKKPSQPKKSAQAKKTSQSEKTSQPKKAGTEKTAQTESELMNLQLLSLLQRAFDISAQDNGWVSLSALGDALRRLEPSFDTRTYGHKTLSGLVKSLPDMFDVKGADNKTGPSMIYVRLKET
jgi:cytoskeletal protein RodZ